MCLPARRSMHTHCLSLPRGPRRGGRTCDRTVTECSRPGQQYGDHRVKIKAVDSHVQLVTPDPWPSTSDCCSAARDNPPITSHNINRVLALGRHLLLLLLPQTICAYHITSCSSVTGCLALLQQASSERKPLDKSSSEAPTAPPPLGLEHTARVQRAC